MSPRLVSLIGLVSAAAVGLAACSNPVDEAPNNLNRGEQDVASGGDGAGDGGAPACGCLQPGVVWRFDLLQLDSIDKGQHLVQGTLNSLWKKDIAAFELNFFAEVVAVTDAAVRVRVVNAARRAETASDLCLLPYTGVEMDFPRTGCALGPTPPSGMNVYAGTPANPKNCAPKLPWPGVTHVIPVRGAVLSMLATADCQRVDQGVVSAGHLPKTALGLTCTCVTTGKQTAETCGDLDPSYADKGCAGCNDKYQNLLDLLKAFSGDKGDLDYLCDEAGEPAACLTASFAGERVAGLPESCSGT
jgi:hypothetical protein